MVEIAGIKLSRVHILNLPLLKKDIPREILGGGLCVVIEVDIFFTLHMVSRQCPESNDCYHEHITFCFT